jgi:pimeloyl-ACP methyl ester carboxylesterase
MTHQLLQYRDSLVSYYRFGSGDQPVFCFHGYGETALSFSFLEQAYGSQYSFHAIELPYHGQTDWKEGLQFSITDLQQLLSLVPLPGNIKPLLMGFSLGGRMALCLYQASPASFKKLVLLAPDGLLMNPWYWFATQTFIGNRLFRFTMKYPGWFFMLLNLLNKTGRVNASVFKFVNAYIGQPGLRRLLYQRWTVLRKLRPDLTRIRRQINQHGTPVELLYGRHDRIILSARGEKFRKGIEGNCTLTILNAGHQLLQAKYADAIGAALK